MDRTWRSLTALCSLLSVAAAQSAPATSEPASRPRGVVQGVVLGPLGDPVAQAEVRAVLWPDTERLVARGRTDGSGTFHLSHVPTGGFAWVRATAPGLTTGLGTADLRKGSEAAVRLRLWPAGVVRGRLLDAAGQAVAGAEVLGTRDFLWLAGSFESPQVRSDQDGRFVLTGVPFGAFTVRALAPGQAMLEHTGMLLHEVELQLRLPPEPGVRLVVRARGLGPTLQAPARVHIYPTRSGSGFKVPRSVENGVLGADGTWEVAGLPDCEWHLSVEAPGWTFDPRNVELKPGKAVHEVELTAHADGSLAMRGVLRTPDGKPIAGQRLRCHTQRSQSMSGGRPAEVVTDVEGRFELLAPLVPDEPFSLHLVDSTWVLQQRKGEGNTRRHDLRYLIRHEDKARPGGELALVGVPGARVSGRLLDAGDRPVPFQWIELQESSSPNRSPQWMALTNATTRQDGSFEFPPVHGGLEFDLRVRVEDTGGAGESEPFRLVAGEVRSGLVVRAKSPGRVEGRVCDAKGAPRPGVLVSLGNYDVESEQQTDGHGSNVLTDHDGRYCFVGVAPGGHRVSLGFRGTPGAQSEVFAVEAGARVKLQTLVSDT